jgi:hypothetical protein
MVVIWTKGKSHLIADALSRAPIFDPPEDSGDHMALCYSVQPKDPLLHAIYNAVIEDPVYQSLVTAIKRGKFISKLHKGHPGKIYKSVWDQILNLDNAILIIGATKMIIPATIRPLLQKQLHVAHAGITRTRELAKKHYFWPGMLTDIAAMINDCDKCIYLRPSQAAEPLQCQQRPTEPLQSVSLDLYEVRGSHYVVKCDRYSYFCWAVPLTTLKSSTVIVNMNAWFCGVGFPQFIYSDNGP